MTKRGFQKGPQKWAQIVKMSSKRLLKRGFQKNSKQCPFPAPLNVPKVCKGHQNRWFLCSGLRSLGGLFLGSFWEPKWRPKAWKSGSQKSFKNRSRKWSIFDRFWGPFGVPNGARKVQIRVHKGLLSQVGSPGGPRGSPGVDFGRIFVDFWKLFRRVFGHF